MHIAAWDYYADRACASVGLARTASLIAQARAEAANCLLFDNGDLLQGSPLGDHVALVAGPRAPGLPHPMFAAMAPLGYDAGTLGNHDFNYGLDWLLTALSGAGFPVVVANLARRHGAAPRDDDTLLPPWTILHRQVIDGAGARHDLRVGVIGFAPPQVMEWERHHLADHLVARDIAEAAAGHLPDLLAAGADIVIALSHSGIGPCCASAGMENASTVLGGMPGIDAVIAGHAHLVFPGPDVPPGPGIDPERGMLGGTPAVMPGFYGSHLGVIDLHLQRRDGSWQVAASRAEARPISARTPQGRVEALVADVAAVRRPAASAHAATLRWTRRPVGLSSEPLHSYFALAADTPAVRLVAAAQRAHALRALAGGGLAGLPLLAAAAPFKAGGRGGPQNYTDVPAGPVALRHAADLYVHPNTVAVLQLTGAEVADWLERAAAIWNRIVPGTQDTPLIDTAFASFNFDLIAGLGFAVDLSVPARFDLHGTLVAPGAHRIRDLTLDEVPLAPDATCLVATNSYRISGGIGRPGAWPGRLVFESPDSIRDIVIAHLAEAPPPPVDPAPPPAPGWRFAPMPGTAVTFMTGPAARAHLGDIAHLAPQDLGLTGKGFLKLRLHL